MKAFVFVAIGLQAIVSLVVGVRLLRLALSSRQIPELSLSLNTLLLPAVGFPMMVASLAMEKFGIPGSLIAHTLGGVATAVAGSMAWVFTWRVFRPGSRLAAFATLCAIVVFLAVVALATGVVVEHSIENAGPHMGRWVLGFPLAGLVGNGWAMAESFSCFAAMRKRLRLGLADPVVCNRFLVFSILTACWTMAMSCLFVVLWMQASPFETSWFVAVTSVAGVVNASCLVLAFMPPRGYTDRIRGSAAPA